MIWVRPDLERLFAGLVFEDFLALGQRPVRHDPESSRSTSWFERGGRGFFVKTHAGAGWKEIAKNWLQLKRAFVDALTEVRALERCSALELPVPRLAAFGCAGRNPARRRSFVVTEALEDTERLSEFLARELRPGTAFELRRSVARSLGTIAGTLHGANLVHRDLYLEHFLVAVGADGSPELHLIDLHRTGPRSQGSSRWRLKDLAALAYSARELPLTRTDRLRFARAYAACAGTRASEREERRLWERVAARARTLPAGRTG